MVNRLKNKRDDRKGKGFTYKERDPKKLKERAEQQGGTFDSIFKQGVDTWRPKQGDNQVRILPPTWDGHDHYGYDVYVHSYVGADQSTYLCPKKMKNDRCPICEAAAEAKAAGETEDAKDLQVKKQSLVYILDRNGEDPEQPQVWAMSWTFDRDIAALCHTKKTGKLLTIDHPDKGYDVMFKRTGTKLQTRYVGIQIDREATPILDDEDDQDRVLDFIQGAPLDSLLKFYDEDYLQKVVDGTGEKGADKDEDEDDDRGSRRRRSRDDDDEDAKPARRRGKADDDDEEEKPSRRSRGKADDDDEEAKPARRRGRDADDDEEEKPARRRSRDDDEEEKPRGRRSRDDDEEEKPARRRGRDADDDGDKDEEEKPRGRRSRDDDEDEGRGSRKRSSRDTDDGDDEADPADEDEGDPEEDTRSSRRRSRDKDDDSGDDEDEKPSRRRSRDDDDEEEKPARRRARDDDDEEEKPARRGERVKRK